MEASGRILVIGAGTMGRGIAGLCALSGYDTRVFDADSGDELPRGEVPARAVAVGSTRVKAFPGGDFGLPCVLVLRTLAEDEIHDKLALNEVLREHGVAP